MHRRDADTFLANHNTIFFCFNCGASSFGALKYYGRLLHLIITPCSVVKLHWGDVVPFVFNETTRVQHSMNLESVLFSYQSKVVGIMLPLIENIANNGMLRSAYTIAQPEKSQENFILIRISFQKQKKQ